MLPLELYSARQKKLAAPLSDVYSYDSFSAPLRQQVAFVIGDMLGSSEAYWGRNELIKGAYQYVVESLCREFGVEELADPNSYDDRDYRTELLLFFKNSLLVEQTLDAIELSFNVLEGNNIHHEPPEKYNRRVENSVATLNYRFKQHGMGYQYAASKIIRIDSEFLHVETVLPALQLLHDRGYAGPEKEFALAHEHFRHGRVEESMNECLKAFESTMKSICTEKNWEYKSKAAAKDLIDICFEKGLIPAYWSDAIMNLKQLLVGSIPTGRNKASGHGAGIVPRDNPPHLAAYMLHMTGSTIVFLCESAKIYVAPNP